MTYKDIENANAQIRTIAIERKGKTGKPETKEYAEVNQRIKAFRMVFPDGFIHTELVNDMAGVCTFRAIVGYYEDGVQRVLGTGTAYEKENSTFINKTSYIENCETSAVGRALGMAGFGIDTSVASAEEVQNAMLNQKKKESRKITRDEADELRYKCQQDGVNIARLCGVYKVKAPEELAIDQLENALQFWEQVKKACGGGL